MSRKCHGRDLIAADSATTNKTVSREWDDSEQIKFNRLQSAPIFDTSQKLEPTEFSEPIRQDSEKDVTRYHWTSQDSAPIRADFSVGSLSGAQSGPV